MQVQFDLTSAKEVWGTVLVSLVAGFLHTPMDVDI